MHTAIDMAIDNSTAGNYGPDNARSKTNFTQLGGTLGAGGEVALTGRWSLGLEYDYLHFGDHDVATPPAGPISGGGLPGIVGSTAPDGRAASVSQDVHAVKIALNYRLYDYGAPPTLDELAGNVQAVHVPGSRPSSEVATSMDGRASRRISATAPMALPVNNSRLTWDKMTTNSGELFGRIDTPENIMVKGFLGAGRGDQGHINDEDWGNRTPDPPAPATLVTGYSNTDSATTEKIRYFTLDVGYDVLRAPNYKVTPFVGYSYFRYMLSAFGCTDLTSVAGRQLHATRTRRTAQLFLREKDFLDLLAARHVRRADAHPMAEIDRRHRLSAHRAASGGWITIRSGPTAPSTRSSAEGHGTGVQVEGVISYDVTSAFSLGVGGRYWAMQIPSGKTNFFSRVQQLHQSGFAAEQTAVFVQGSYKFAGPFD